jgi:hypothetical protein
MEADVRQTYPCSMLVGFEGTPTGNSQPELGIFEMKLIMDAYDRVQSVAPVNLKRMLRQMVTYWALECINKLPDDEHKTFLLGTTPHENRSRIQKVKGTFGHMLSAYHPDMFRDLMKEFFYEMCSLDEFENGIELIDEDDESENGVMSVEVGDHKLPVMPIVVDEKTIVPPVTPDESQKPLPTAVPVQPRKAVVDPQPKNEDIKTIAPIVSKTVDIPKACAGQKPAPVLRRVKWLDPNQNLDEKASSRQL